MNFIKRESTAGPAKLRAVVPAAASAGPTHTALAALLLVVLAFALALLGGCGLGLGGTGTGATADAMAAYGARDVPVCESDFADLIGCNAPSAGAAPLPAGGALLRRVVAGQRHAAGARRQRSAVESALRRHRLHRQLGQVGTAAPRYYGNAIEGGSRVQLASMQVQRSGNGVNVTLVDSLGRVIAGPLLLTPVAGTTNAAACP
ncbi:MAG: hypothetical protein U1F67_12035 [Rubrivivax sp.]